MSKTKGKKTTDGHMDGFSDHELQNAHGRERSVVENLFLPFFLILMGCAWFTWGSIGLSADANGFSLHPDRKMTPDELAALEARKKAKRSENLYLAHCSACHQSHGGGTPGAFPPLDSSEWLDDEKRVVSLVLGGMSGPVEVMGQPYNNMMPAIAKSSNLKPEEIKSIVNYVRSAWGNGAKEYPDVTVEAVEAAMEEMGDRSVPWTAEELLQKFPIGGSK
ncbi:MAG: hypothetical protein CMI32_02560 [Opitutales bacterium]|nr:hypothetical protein [Opitutales bacterium]